jgi:hypothetical protein
MSLSITYIGYLGGLDLLKGGNIIDKLNIAFKKVE